MNRGVILFAFNSDKNDYYAMAVATAKRINYFLNLPTTVITNSESITDTTYKFDKTIIATADTSNKRDKQIWINKGRYQAYALSPYDETILIDTDYLINSDTLNKLFELPTDFCCHDTTSFLMQPTATQEVLSAYSVKTLWATVMAFKKTSRAKQIFECIEMIQNNYNHYANIHTFVGGLYRNDYALTLALKITNGHLDSKQDTIPWNLLHVGKNTQVYKNTKDEFNSEYTAMFDNWQRGKIRKEYITVSDTDFHVMSKTNFIELMK